MDPKLLKAIKDKYGLKFSSARDIPNVTRLTTGSLALDIGLGGGIPKSRCTFISGRHSVAKTAVCYHLIAEAQKNYPDKETGWIALEPFDENWARINGVDTDKLYVARPEDGEEATDIYQALLSTRDFSVLVLDSIGQLAPGDEVEETADKSFMTNKRAKVVKRMLLKASSALQPSKDKENECACVFITHHYDSPDQWTQYVIAGGRNVFMTGSLIVSFQKKSYLWAGEENKSEKIGIEVGVKIEKDKIIGEGQPFTFKFYNKNGEQGIAGSFDDIDAIITLGQLTDPPIITTAGAWYSLYNGEKAMGREKFSALIKNSGLEDSIKKDIKKRIK